MNDLKNNLPMRDDFLKNRLFLTFLHTPCIAMDLSSLRAMPVASRFFPLQKAIMSSVAMRCGTLHGTD